MIRGVKTSFPESSFPGCRIIRKRPSGATWYMRLPPPLRQGGDIQARETDGQYFPEGEQVLIRGDSAGWRGSVDATS